MHPPASGPKHAPVRFRLTALLLVFSLLALAIPTQYIPFIPTAEAAAGDLFFSEYIEGSSNNKALEIYNPSGAAVNLATAGYTVEMYFNGVTTVGFTATLAGTVPANGTFVLAPTNANATILAAANQQAGASWFNGDDAVLLKKAGVIVDSIGQVGFDPGTEWGSGLQSTADNTIRRRSNVCTGDTNSTDAFSPAVEWDGFATDTFNGLGSHTALCGGDPTPTPPPTPGALQFSATTYSVSEGGASVTITVTRTGGSDGAVSVNYATSNGSATSGDDYTAASGTLNFANGDTTGKTFSVPVIEDAAFEGDETVNLTLSNPTGGATLGGTAAAVLTITDNEAAPTPTPVTPGSVVISQVYGGGGNSGALYKNDFVEIFNRSSNAVDLNGWSVQYTSAAGPTGGGDWSGRTPLSGTIAPGQYILVQGAAGTNGDGANLPPVDVTGSVNMSATDGKVALVSSTTFLNGTCPSGNTTVVDFVGYGSATCYEGTAAVPALTSSKAALRTRNGCKDTDLNNLNFTVVAPTPRNSSSPSNVCPAGDFAPEVFSTDPANGSFNYPLASNVKVNFDAAVNVMNGGFTLSCSTSGAHSLAVTTVNSTTFTLNPDTDFAPGETCTATVLASHVTSQTASPVPMVANYVWTFGTLIVRDPAEHMVMGNPSGAVADEAAPLNYLMMKPQYALSYNNDKGTPNWTSWHLDSSWTTGVADRQDDFRPDPTLPAGFKHVASGFRASTYGFDRGHMVPSADRTSSIEDNSATFLMTNMIPQASGNNQGPWADLENHLRTLLNGAGNELYVVSGGHGVGGTSSTGNWDSITDTGGNVVTVPDLTWKVVLVMPRAGGDDVARVDTATRTFAVIMPNNDNIRPDDWQKYLATVDQVEALTGYDFFSSVPVAIQNVIEAQLDAEYDTAPVANNQSVTTAEDTAKAVTLSASDFNVNNVLTYTVVSGPSHGQLDGTGDALTYTPNADYNGPDSFTFRVNDGGKNSNTATVQLNVTAVNDAPSANDDTFTADEDAAAAEVNVTGNDTDVENDALTVTEVGSASHGTATVVAGVVRYAPAANYHGADSFSYTVSDGNGGTATATVNVTVNSVNDAPSATADSAETDEDTPVTVDVVFNDTDTEGDTLTLDEVSNATHGAVAVAGGKAVFTPDANYNGPASFSYVVSDGNGGTATGTVSLTVNPVNDAPTLAGVPAAPVNVNELTAYAFTATAGDVDGDALTFSLVGAPEGAGINQSGVFNWTPTEAQGGNGSPYSFTVRVSDGTVNTDAQVSITVGEVNQAPTLAQINNQTVVLGATLSLTAAGADGDVPVQTLTYGLTGAVPPGATINASTGELSWTPTAAQAGHVYTLTVSVSDGQLSAERTFTVGVAYTMTGVLQPLRADGVTTFKAGQTVPVKFQLTGASAGVTDAVVRLYVAKVSNAVIGEETAAGSTSNATEGNLFRYADGLYIFNLSTAGMAPGTYQLRIDAGDGVPHVVTISLR